jgi:hypothetical protein
MLVVECWEKKWPRCKILMTLSITPLGDVTPLVPNVSENFAASIFRLEENGSLSDMSITTTLHKSN